MPAKKTANKWTVETVLLTDVKPFEDNPRTIKDKRLSALRASVNRFGYVDLIVWNKRTGHIVGGHQRFKILVEQGVKEAKMLVVDLSEKEELAANLTLNNPNIEGDWDDPIEELLGRVEQVDPEFFADANFDALRKAVSNMTPDPGDDDTDTECPCCSHRWAISDKDVVVLTKDEQASLAEEEEYDPDDFWRDS
jgi:hypothetical protein